MSYKALNRSIELEHLSEGQVINIPEYIEKLEFFKKYHKYPGTYIVDRRYVQYSGTGLHYYKYDTLIRFFTDLRKRYGLNYAKITFGKTYKLKCMPLSDESAKEEQQNGS